MHIDLIDETETLLQESIDLIDSLLNHAANHLRLSPVAECSVTFVDNERIQEINRDYRGKDMPTDVISFALDDDTTDQIIASGVESAPHLLGDIIISVDKAKEQAIEYQHSFERELGFLAVHGFLHLNGFDHIEEADEKEMFTLQDELLESYGLSRF